MLEQVSLQKIVIDYCLWAGHTESEKGILAPSSVFETHHARWKSQYRNRLLGPRACRLAGWAIGILQGLVMQSLISGDMEKMRADTPRAFAIYRCGISVSQTGEMTGGAPA